MKTNDWLSNCSRLFTAVAIVIGAAVYVPAAEPIPSITSIAERFAPASGQSAPASDEVPSFQRHVSPLLGRLGCNGRACHGSFQGRGDLRLSLFGYDFEADHKALLEHGRVDRDKPLESLVLTKPVDADMHEGGKRFEVGGWEYWVLRRWIEAKAPFASDKIEKLEQLRIEPTSITFRKTGETQQLKVFAHWQSGVIEDVTCLCRFQTNDPAVATVNERGLITGGDVGDTHVVVSYDNAVVPIELLRPYSELDDRSYPQVASATKVDELVNAKLRKIGVVPSQLCSDEEFLRRASLDVTGTLPTATEVIAFAADTNPKKRAAKIDELLERPGYVAQWTTFFCDMTGNNDDQLRNFLPVQRGDVASTQWYQWIHERLEKNVPYDEMVEGIVTAKSRLPGESYEEYCQAMSECCQDRSGEKYAERPGLVHYWARQNFRTTEEKAIGFAYSFLGVRIQCAQCHKHPFDQWTKSDFDNFERLFGGFQANQNSIAADGKKEFNKMVSTLGLDSNLKGNNLRKELAIKLDAGKTVPFPELLVNSRAGARDKDKDKDKKDKNKGRNVPEVAKAKLLGGDWVTLDEPDVRGKLMSWLRSADNPYFAKALVNRVWAQYFSIGIVNPSDDLNLANAPSNAPLFDYLAKGFIDNKFDLKWLHREILNSHAYQRSWIVNDTNRLDKRNFSHSLIRRLPAEAAHDAVYMALANDRRAEEVARGARSRALSMPGASAQSRGNDTTYALSVFGRSIRESNCDCDRSNEPSLLQTVFLLNDAAVQNWLRDPEQSWVAAVAKEHGWSLKSARTGQSPGQSSGKNVPEMNDPKMARRLAEAQAQYEKQSQKLAERLQEAESKNQAEVVADLKKRQQQMDDLIAKAKRRAESMKALAADDHDEAGDRAVQSPSSSKTSGGMTEDLARSITEQAYLRSLSRRPNADELSTSVRFLCSEQDPAVAVESLIWSIVNTKEFILNH